MGTLLAIEKEACHQEEITEVKQRIRLGVKNGGNSPRGRSTKMEKRTMLGCSAGCTLNQWSPTFSGTRDGFCGRSGMGWVGGNRRRSSGDLSLQPGWVSLH